jgi:hypothetical protein
MIVTVYALDIARSRAQSTHQGIGFETMLTSLSGWKSMMNSTITMSIQLRPGQTD